MFVGLKCGKDVQTRNTLHGLDKEGCKHGPEHTTYVRWKNPRIGNIYNSMRSRCCNPSSSSYYRYGGRGISVCSRWEMFENFLADMGERPKTKNKNGNLEYSIDRIDNDGNYCPENCRWATQIEQVRNSTNSIGKRVHIWEIQESGISKSVIYKRLKKGWSKKDAMQTPVTKAIPALSSHIKKGCILRILAQRYIIEGSISLGDIIGSL